MKSYPGIHWIQTFMKKSCAKDFREQVTTIDMTTRQLMFINMVTSSLMAFVAVNTMDDDNFAIAFEANNNVLILQITAKVFQRKIM